ncbi:MAG: GMC oxidoreductase [Bacillota bacterium]
MRIYVAGEKDTLKKIALIYEASLNDCLSINPHITNPDQEIHGMVVNIPGQVSSQLPVPACPLAEPAKLIDQWVPLTPLSKMEQTEYDVLIIGSGTGGGAALWRLCEQAGKNRIKIGIIERGDLLLPTAALNVPTLSNWDDMLEYYLNPKISAPIGKMLPEYPEARLVYALGGRTLFWAATTPRIPPFEFTNWPITYKEIEPYYNIAEQMMKVSRYSSPFSQLLLRRLWQNGYPESGLLPEAVDRNGYNVYFSSLVFFSEALRLGSFDLAVNARAIQILTKGQNVTGVKVMSRDKSSYFLKAKNVIVAGSTFETPRLLLYSGIPGRAIGHYLINHSYLKSQGFLRPEDSTEGRVSLLIPETKNRPYQFKIEGEKMYLEYDVTGRILSRFENYVYLDPGKPDEYGIPGIQVNFSYSEADKAVIGEMVEAIHHVASVMKVKLASTVNRPEICIWPPGADNHDAGTCRMGEDPLTSATNRYGQIHGISGLYVADNSLIPALGPVNPTLTTAALAIRTADYVVRQLIHAAQ